MAPLLRQINIPLDSRPKASDISDEFVLGVIDKIQKEQGRWTFIHEVHEAVQSAADPLEWPFKVTQAKCRQMIAKGRIDGCGCGCRGDLKRKGEK